VASEPGPDPRDRIASDPHEALKMPDLLVTHALPNPAGKDRQHPYAPSNDQLNREWVEFANASARTLSMQGVAISHYTFDRACGRTGEDQLTSFTGNLDPGRSIRLHTGRGQAWDEGTVRHLYADRSNYAWNNVCGDTAVLRSSRGDVIDWASYDPDPPEGVVLTRLPGTNKLSAARTARTA
jgi:hypothetical protein